MASPTAVAAEGRVARKPQSLVDFLISRGGVQDQGGDLKAIGADTVHHQQGGRLVNPRGVYPDYAREAAEEAGFLRPNSTTADLYNAIADEVAGRPVYRQSEQAEGDIWAANQREAARQAAAYDRARTAVGMAESDAGARLSDDAIEHATQLVIQGVHPQEAIHHAARGGEEVALTRNAQRLAFGQPGVPPAAQQAEIPAHSGLTPNFDEAAAARYRAANAAHAQRVQTYEAAPGVGAVLKSGQRAGEYKMGDSQVAANLFSSSGNAAERIQAFLKAAQSNPALVDDLKDYAAWSLRQAAEQKDGTLNLNAYDRWTKAHQQALAAFPDLQARFATAQRAQQMLDDAMARQVQQRAAFEKSAASHFLGDADPVRRVGQILRSDTAQATMADLGRLTQNDPAAREGLRRAVVEYILHDLSSNTLAGNTGTNILNSNTLQTFIRRASDPLRAIFSDEEIANMRNVAADLQRANKSIAGSKLPGGSNTAQDLAAGERHAGGHNPSVLSQLIVAEAIGEAAQHATGIIGRVVGMVTVPVVSAMRQAGLKNVNDLVTQAMLHPELARSLLAKVPTASGGTAWGKIIGQQIRALVTSSSLNSGRDEQKPSRLHALLATPPSTPVVSVGVR